jgi:hypothetical protein
MSELREALRHLYSEVSGMTERELRAVLGNTNFAYLELRVKEAKEALAAASAPADQPQEHEIKLAQLIEAKRVLGTGITNFKNWLEKRIAAESRLVPKEQAK